jgi:hypothetical protein
MKSLLPWTSALIGGALALGFDPTAAPANVGELPSGSVRPGPQGTLAPRALHGAESPASLRFARSLPDLGPDIEENDLERLLEEFCSPYLEGRDTPSLGLEYTAERIAAHLASFGCQPPEANEQVTGFFHTYSLERPQPDAGRCSFEVQDLEADDAALAAAGLDDGWTLDEDYTPLLRAEGSAEGRLQFCGYGIDVKGYRGLDGLEVDGRIAVFVEGEPRHKRVLEGPELSPASNTYRKLQRFEHEGAEGAIVVRLPPEAEFAPPPDWPERTPVRFRSTWASWVGERPGERGPVNLPVVEIGWDQAKLLLNLDLDEVMERIDKTGKPHPVEPSEVEVRFESRVRTASTPLRNVVAVLPGSDPERAREWVVLGAHYDHIGVDPRGRVAVGADDNASGLSALLEAAHALAADPPPRSVLFCAFSAEEDGLLGSRAVANDPPVPADRILAMVNLDMVGRGSDKEVVALGVRENPDFEDVLTRAKRRSKSGISRIETQKAQALFQRSDHYSFHTRGYPALFLFEQPDIEDNPDYHTYRDVLDELNLKKVLRVAKLAEAVVREIAELEDSLPRPSGR